MSQEQKDSETNIWPPAIARADSVRVKNRGLYPEFAFAIALNIAIALLNIPKMLLPAHSVIDGEPLIVPLSVVIDLGILISAPASIWRFFVCLRKYDSPVQPIITLLLSITPLPLNIYLFELLVNLKHLVDWSS